MEEEAHGPIPSCQESADLVHVCSYPGCSKTFSRPNRLIIHLRTHTGEKPYICEVEGCGKQYARSAHLKRHQDTAHITDDSPALVSSKCCCTEDGCSLVFKNNQHLQRHINRRHKTILYKCNFEGCEKTFNKHQHLKTHEFEHTKINPYICPHEGCDLSFRVQSKLKRHLKVHAGYSCEEEGCTETFPTWTLLRKHKAFDHSQEYKCTECGKAFKQKQWLRQHKKIHSSSRELFACQWENCGRSYLDHRNLMAHIRSYHEGRRFACKHGGCDRKFVTEQKLKEHQEIHESGRPAHKKRPKPKKPKTKSKTKKVAAKLLGIDPLIACDIQMTSESELEIDSANESKTVCENSSDETRIDHDVKISCMQNEICRSEFGSHDHKKFTENNKEHPEMDTALLTSPGFENAPQQSSETNDQSHVSKEPACMINSDSSCPTNVDSTILGLTVQDLIKQRETNGSNLVESKSDKCLKSSCSLECAKETKDCVKVTSADKNSIQGQSCMTNSFVSSSNCVHEHSCLTGNDDSLGNDGKGSSGSDGKILTDIVGMDSTGGNDEEFFTGKEGKCLTGDDENKNSVIDIAFCGKEVNWNVDLTTSLFEI